MRHVSSTEQLADILTKGACTPIQWKSLMRLFNIQPPSNLYVDSSFSEPSCSAASQMTLLAMSNATSSQRELEHGPWEEKPEESSHGVRSAWRNPMFCSSSDAWRDPVRSSEQGGAESDADSQEVCQKSMLTGNSIKKEVSIEVETLRKDSSLCHDLTPEKMSMRSVMEHKYSEVQFIQDAPAGSLVVFSHRGTSLSRR